MQTRRLGLRGFTLAMAGVLTFGMTACEETKVVPPVAETTLTVSPSGPVDLFVGETVTLSAAVQNGPAGAAVEASSSNTDVVTTSVNGNQVTVNAVGEGTATVNVGVAGTNASSSVLIRVSARDGEVPSGGDANIIIEGLFDETGEMVVDPDQVQGQVVLRLSVDRGNADSLVVTLQGEDVSEVVCRQTFNNAQEIAAQATLLCPINTAAFEIVNGEVQIRYNNGPAQIVARLYESDTVVASASTGEITLANQDQVVLRTAVDNGDDPDTEINPNTNRIWAGGSVTVTAIPVMFSGAAVQDAQIGLFIDDNTANSAFEDGDMVTQNVELDGGVWTATFSEEDDVDGVEAQFVFPFLGELDEFGTAITAGGQEVSLLQVWDTASFQRVAQVTVEGQDQFLANVFRLDNQGPTTPTFTMMPYVYPSGDTADARFINGEFAFTTGEERLFPEGGPVDLGVNDTEVSFFVDDAEVTMGADLAPSENQTEYTAEYVAVDLLGNESDDETDATFGVDVVSPDIEYTAASVEDETVFVSDSAVDSNKWEVVATDTSASAGFSDVIYFAHVEQLLPDDVTCGPTVETIEGTTDMPCEESSSFEYELIADGENEVLVPLTSDDAYYTFSAVAIDQAGNVSEPVETRMVLVDDEAPEVRNVVLPSSFSTGEELGVRADMTDNVDLWKWDVTEGFSMADSSYIAASGAVAHVPFEMPEILNSPFNGDPLGDATGTSSAEYVASFSVFDPAQSNENQVCSQPIEVGVRVWDATSYWINDDNTRTLGAVDLEDPACFAGTDEIESWTMDGTGSAQLRGDAEDFDSPFSGGAVMFYYIDGDRIFLMGEATSVVTVDTGTDRYVEYTAPDFDFPARDVTVFAVGITPAGDALATQNSSVEVYTPPAN